MVENIVDRAEKLTYSVNKKLPKLINADNPTKLSGVSQRSIFTGSTEQSQV